MTAPGMAGMAGAQAMDPRMKMAMEAQRQQAAMGGMKKGGKVKKPDMFQIIDKDGKVIDNPNIGGPSQFYDSDEKKAATRKASIKNSERIAKQRKEAVKNAPKLSDMFQIIDKDGKVIDNPNIGGPSQFYDSDEKKAATRKASIKNSERIAKQRKEAVKNAPKLSDMFQIIDKDGKVIDNPNIGGPSQFYDSDEKKAATRKASIKNSERIAKQRKEAVKNPPKLSDMVKRGGFGMKKGGKVKKMKKGGAVKGSASKRADGIAQKGHTRGRMV